MSIQSQTILIGAVEFHLTVEGSGQVRLVLTEPVVRRSTVVQMTREQAATLGRIFMAIAESAT